MHSEFLYNPDGCGLHCHAPSLLTTRTGTVLAVWYAYQAEEHIGARLVLARKSSGAREWNKSEVLLAPLPYSVANPVLFDEPAAGKIWLLFVGLKGGHWNHGEVQAVWSDDDGKTWSDPDTVWTGRGVMVRHPPVATAEGLLLPAYDEASRQAVLLRRTTGERRWHEAHRFVSPPLLQPALVRDAPGRLSLFFRPWIDPRVVWRSHSTTEGRQWSDPMRTTQPCPLSGVAAFALADRIGLVYNHTDAHARYPLSLSTSRDGGLSWSEPWHFERIDYEVSYPQFHERPDGGAHGVYSYNRRVIKYVCFEPREIP